METINWRLTDKERLNIEQFIREHYLVIEGIVIRDYVDLVKHYPAKIRFLERPFPLREHTVDRRLLLTL